MRFPLVIFFVVIMWEVLPRIFNIPTFVFPTLSSVLLSLAENFKIVWWNTSGTLVAIIISLFLTVLFGVMLAIINAEFQTIRQVLEPLVLITQVIPRIALVPLLIIWFDQGLQAKIIISVIIAFFPIYEGLRSGLDKPEDDLINRAKLFGYQRGNVLLKIRLPRALPNFFLGLKSSVLLVVVGVVVAEFIATGNGVGYKIVERIGRSDITGAFGYILVISVIGMLLYYCVYLIEKSVLTRLRLT